MHEAKTHFSRILERVEAGDVVVITGEGKPIARVVPLEGQMAYGRLNFLAGEFRFSRDFDRLASDEIAALFRWFVCVDLEASARHATTFRKNRQRLLAGDVARAFLAEVVGPARRRGLMSSEHFTVDGNLLEAYASHKSLRRKDDDSDAALDPENDGVNFHGERRSHATHQSVRDPDTRLARKSSQTSCILAYEATVLVENRNGLVFDGMGGTRAATPKPNRAWCCSRGSRRARATLSAGTRATIAARSSRRVGSSASRRTSRRQ